VDQPSGDIVYLKVYTAVKMYAYSVPELLASAIKGYSHIMFSSERYPGFIVLGAIFVASPILAVHSLLGAFSELVFTVLTGSPAPLYSDLEKNSPALVSLWGIQYWY
jgi:urea transporter